MTNQELQNYKDKRNLDKGFNAYWNKGFDEAVTLLNKAQAEQLNLSGVIVPKGTLCEVFHSTDFTGKCFNCNEQIFVK